MALHPIVIATPVALTLMAIEHGVARYKGTSVYRLEGAVSDLFCSLGNVIGQGFFGLTTFAAYLWMQSHFTLLEFDRSWISWVAVFMLVDLAFYWRHRACHRVALLWAIHEVHHQPEEYNFGTAQRAPVLQSLPNLPFAMALAALGIPLEMAVACFTAKAAYGFFTHTQLVGKLGPLEWFAVTPSSHRVHHACNPEYLDKNYGNCLIIWDRLFGTFEDEVAEPVFGTVHSRGTDDPWACNVDPFTELFAKAKSAPTWWASIETLLRPPAWNPHTRREELPGAPTSAEYPRSANRPLLVAGLALCIVGTMGGLSLEQVPVLVSLLLGAALLAGVNAAALLPDHTEFRAWTGHKAVKVASLVALLVVSGGLIYAPDLVLHMRGSLAVVHHMVKVDRSVES